MRLIDADALREQIARAAERTDHPIVKVAFLGAMAILDAAPSIDCAAIAELQATRDTLRDRRCEGCGEWQGDEWRHNKACPVYFLNEMDRMRGRGADDFPPADFACNRWVARKQS